MKRFLITLAIILGVAILAVSGWLAYNAINNRQNNTPNPSVGSFDECVAAGNPVMETDPRQCRTPEGTTFTEEVADEPADVKTESKVYTSDKGVDVIVYDWQDDKTLTSPVTIRGKIPGSWSFEASFPVSLLGADDTVLAQSTAQIDGEWMTDAHVPFNVTLTFDEPGTETTGRLILRKDNPSGLAENDDVIAIPIRLGAS